MKKAISTNGAPAAIGPYSQAIDCGEFVFTSGQLGLDPATGKLVDGGVQAQATQAMKNIQAVLTAAGLTLDNVVKTTVLLTNIADFAAVNEVYASFFEGTTYPARCAYQVSALPAGGWWKSRPSARSDRNHLPALYLHSDFSVNEKLRSGRSSDQALRPMYRDVFPCSLFGKSWIFLCIGPEIFPLYPKPLAPGHAGGLFLYTQPCTRGTALTDRPSCLQERYREISGKAGYQFSFLRRSIRPAPRAHTSIPLTHSTS